MKEAPTSREKSTIGIETSVGRRKLTPADVAAQGFQNMADKKRQIAELKKKRREDLTAKKARLAEVVRETAVTTSSVLADQILVDEAVIPTVGPTIPYVEVQSHVEVRTSEGCGESQPSRARSQSAPSSSSGSNVWGDMTPAEVMVMTEATGIFGDHPDAGLLAISALQQFPDDLNRMEKDLQTCISKGQALVSQGYLYLNNALAQSLAISTAKAAKLKEVEDASSRYKTQAEIKIAMLERCALEAADRAERSEKLVADLELARVEAVKAKSVAEVERDEAKTELEKLKEANQTLEGRVVELGVELDGVTTQCSQYNTFYVQGWADCAQFGRAPADSRLWDIDNLNIPFPESTVPVLEPLSPREESDV